MKSSPWTEAEISAIRKWVRAGNLDDYKAAVVAVMAVNPSRPANSIRPLVARMVRTERPLTKDLRNRIADKWESVTKRYGDRTRPSAVCWNVGAWKSFPIGFELFVKYSVDLGFLPKGSKWLDLLPETKYCPKCRKDRDKAMFRLDPSSYDGLGHYCSECNSKHVMEWRKSKHASTTNV